VGAGARPTPLVHSYLETREAESRRASTALD
jgi:hypothetical protein